MLVSPFASFPSWSSTAVLAEMGSWIHNSDFDVSIHMILGAHPHILVPGLGASGVSEDQGAWDKAKGLKESVMLLSGAESSQHTIG